MDSRWERMRRVLKRAFAYNGVWWFWSCNPVTDTLLGTPCEIGSASYKFIHHFTIWSSINKPLGALHGIVSAWYKFRHITSPFDPVLIALWEPYVRSDLYPASEHKCMRAVDIHLCFWRYCGCSCCLCSRDKLSSHALRLRLAASQVLDISTNAPRVLVATCSGKIFVRFELIDLIF